MHQTFVIETRVYQRYNLISVMLGMRNMKDSTSRWKYWKNGFKEDETKEWLLMTAGT